MGTYRIVCSMLVELALWASLWWMGWAYAENNTLLFIWMVIAFAVCFVVSGLLDVLRKDNDG
jgi:hypothetical protein